MSQDAKIVLTNICKTYNGSRVLDIESAEIPLEGIIAIIGWSGSGKSTLLNILSLIDQPDTGDKNPRPQIPPKIEIHLPDENYLIEYRDSSGSPHIIRYGTHKVELMDERTFRRRLFGYVFQEHYLHPNLNIEHNIKTPLIIRSKTLSESNDLLKVCDGLGIGGQLGHYVNEVSGGQAQRVSILRAMLKNCPIIFGDELTSNIDYKRASQILDEFETALAREGRESRIISFVWASHDIHLIQKYARKIITIKSGKIQCHDNEDRTRDANAIMALLDDSSQTMGDASAAPGDSENSGHSAADIPSPEKISERPGDLQEPSAENTDSASVNPEPQENTCASPLNMSQKNATMGELIRYYSSYAYRDMFKGVCRPTVDFCVIFLSVTFVILFLLSILKISYASHKYLELKMSDPRINSLEVMGGERIAGELEEKHFFEIKDLLRDCVRYVTPIYYARVTMMGLTRRQLQVNACTFRKDDPTIREILGNSHAPFVTDDKNWKGLIIRKDAAARYGYGEDQNEVLIKFNYFNDQAEEMIPMIQVDTPLPFNRKMMMREEFYLGYYKKLGLEVKPELHYIIVYPENIYDTVRIKNKIEGTRIFDINEAFKVLNKIKIINEIRAQSVVFVNLSIFAIALILLSFIFVTIYRNMRKKRKEIGVFLAYGMEKGSFYIFYLLEALIVSLFTFAVSLTAYKYAIEPMINERLERGSLLDIMGKDISSMNTVIPPEALKIPFEWMACVYGGTYLLLLMLFLSLIYYFTSKKPIRLMRDL